MSQLALDRADDQITQLLDITCEKIQLSASQYEEAERKYKVIGNLFAEEGSPLEPYRPGVFPQGSIRLSTTVRPRRGAEFAEEFDVDLVALLAIDPYRSDAGTVYQLVETALRRSPHHQDLVEPMKRCLRLNYAGEFHMDILPACLDLRRGGDCVLVPDRKLEAWKESNPRGYGKWFDQRALWRPFLKAAREVEGLPPNGSAEMKGPLRRAVQLLKRHRDVVFNGDDDAPRSVVLTTLAAEHYRGEENSLDCLAGLVRRICDQIDESRCILQIRNPTNDAELFSESWTPESYGRFVAFMSGLDASLRDLRTAPGLGMQRIRQILDGLFGENVSKRVIKSYTDRITDARSGKKLLANLGGAATLTTSASRGAIESPTHRFYGS